MNWGNGDEGIIFESKQGIGDEIMHFGYDFGQRKEKEKEKEKEESEGKVHQYNLRIVSISGSFCFAVASQY